MQMIFVKPVEGRRCKDPKSFQLLPEAGRMVPRDGYWLRRLRDGDCILAERKAADTKLVKKKNTENKPKYKKQNEKQNEKEGDK